MATYSTSFKITENREFTINPKDANGNPASLDGNNVNVTVADPAIVQVIRPFGSFTMASQAVGTTIITLDATSNGAPLTETIEVTIQPAVAVTFGVAFKDPVPKG